MCFSLVIGLVVAALDQVTKQLIMGRFALGESAPVIPGCFNLSYLRNTGAVWGMLQYRNQWLVVLSLIVLVLLLVFYRRLVEGRRVYQLALGLMLGGILGNLFDRIKYGWVIDFLDFYWQQWHWPSFNLADSAICVGVAVYLAAWLFSSAARKPGPAAAEPG